MGSVQGGAVLNTVQESAVLNDVLLARRGGDAERCDSSPEPLLARLLPRSFPGRGTNWWTDALEPASGVVVFISVDYTDSLHLSTDL